MTNDEIPNDERMTKRETSGGESENSAGAGAAQNQAAAEPLRFPSHPAVEESLSAEHLINAFAKMLGTAEGAGPAGSGEAATAESTAAGEVSDSRSDPVAPAEEDAGEVSPKSILEAMLFVGNSDNSPLLCERVAELMRGVEPRDIPKLVDELNREYEADNCPYHVASEGAGYRLVLRQEYHRLRDKLYGRVRRARLSRPATEVLAIVAYNQPLTSDDVGRLRGTASSGVLAQLVRRQLLRIERPADKPQKVHYHTTKRFLKLFGLECLDDLPRSQELEKR